MPLTTRLLPSREAASRRTRAGRTGSDARYSSARRPIHRDTLNARIQTRHQLSAQPATEPPDLGQVVGGKVDAEIGDRGSRSKQELGRTIAVTPAEDNESAIELRHRGVVRVVQVRVLGGLREVSLPRALVVAKQQVGRCPCCAYPAGGTEPYKTVRKAQSGYCYGMSEKASLGPERVRAAEVIAALSLATDLGIGVPLEH
jgi:hypothetical protein